MPTLHIEFDPTGGTLFEIKYKLITDTNWQTTTVNGSPVDITVPSSEPYEYCIKKICNPGNNSVDICGTATYIPPCIKPQFSFNSRNNNQFVFNYTLQSNQPQFDIEMTAPAGAIPVITRYQTANNPSPLTITISNMVTGTYRFRMRGVCGISANSGVSDWSDGYVDVAAVVSPCIQPSDILPVTDSAAPTVTLKWNDNLGTEDRNCHIGTCSYTMKIEAADINNDITNMKVMKSIDGGNTWSTLFTTAVNTTFGDSISASGTSMYKIEVTDSGGNVVESNILTYTYSLVTQSYWYQGRWAEGDTIHNPEVNCWVKYLDEFGVQQTQIIGPMEWGCQEVIASSIVQTNGVNTCIP